MTLETVLTLNSQNLKKGGQWLLTRSKIPAFDVVPADQSSPGREGLGCSGDAALGYTERQWGYASGW